MLCTRAVTRKAVGGVPSCPSLCGSRLLSARSAAHLSGETLHLSMSRAQLLRVAAFWLVFAFKRVHSPDQERGEVLDGLRIKGIMIFSDMSAGTNSPKVHPPNGTRFYTIQASGRPPPAFLSLCASLSKCVVAGTLLPCFVPCAVTGPLLSPGLCAFAVQAAYLVMQRCRNAAWEAQSAEHYKSNHT